MKATPRCGKQEGKTLQYNGALSAVVGARDGDIPIHRGRQNSFARHGQPSFADRKTAISVTRAFGDDDEDCITVTRPAKRPDGSTHLRRKIIYKE
jgi:hypothetical protein